jgi:hypothetical protein
MTPFKKYLLFSFIFALVNAVLLLVFFVPRFNHPDTQEYFSTIKYVLGEPGAELFPYRILKPLPILIGAALSPIFGVENTLWVQNIVFYFLSVYLVFLLIFYFYKNEKQAFFGAVLYAGAYPVLAYGLASLTDMSGWFFYLLSIFLSLKFLQKISFKIAILIGFVAGLGMLFKESVAAAAIFFVALVFLAAKIPIKEKIKYVLVFSAAFLFLPVVNNIIIYKIFSFSYLAGYKYAWSNSIGGFASFYMITPFRILIEIVRAFLLGWLFIFLGLKKEIFLKVGDRIRILLALILPSLSFFLWSYPHNRMIFIAAPFLIFLGSFGLLQNLKNRKISNFTELGLLLLYLIINYGLLEFLLRYGTKIQPPGTLFG